MSDFVIVVMVKVFGILVVIDVLFCNGLLCSEVVNLGILVIIYEVGEVFCFDFIVIVVGV